MNKAVMLVVPILVLGGGAFFGLAMTGKIQVAGVTPKSLMKKATKSPTEDSKTTPKVAADSPKPKPKPPKGPDPAQGQTTLAKLWNSLDADKLKDITKTWKTKDLAPVIMKMEPAKQADYLAEIEPSKASELSREIQKLASS